MQSQISPHSIIGHDEESDDSNFGGFLEFHEENGGVHDEKNMILKRVNQQNESLFGGILKSEENTTHLENDGTSVQTDGLDLMKMIDIPTTAFQQQYQEEFNEVSGEETKHEEDIIKLTEKMDSVEWDQDYLNRDNDCEVDQRKYNNPEFQQIIINRNKEFLEKKNKKKIVSQQSIQQQQQFQLTPEEERGEIPITNKKIKTTLDLLFPKKKKQDKNVVDAEIFLSQEQDRQNNLKILQEQQFQQQQQLIKQIKQENEMQIKMVEQKWVKYSQVKWKELISMQEQQQILYQLFIMPIKLPSLFTNKSHPTQPILLYGPKHCGKSELITSFAVEFTQIPALAIDCASLYSNPNNSNIIMYISSIYQRIYLLLERQTKAIEEVLKKKSSKTKPLVFFKDIDDLFGFRDIMEEEEQERMMRARQKQQEVLSLFENLAGRKDINLLASSERPWALQVKIQSLFSKLIGLTWPNKSSKMEYLKKRLKNSNIDEEELQQIANLSKRYSFNHLEQMIIHVNSICQQRAYHSIAVASTNTQQDKSLLSPKLTDYLRYIECNPSQLIGYDKSSFINYQQIRSKLLNPQNINPFNESIGNATYSKNNKLIF